MTLFIELVAICVILVLSLKVVTSDKMLFEKFGEFAKAKVDAGIKRYELVYCVWCAPSIFTAVSFVFAYAFGLFELNNWRILVLYPLVVGASSFICGMLWSFYELIDAKTRYYINAEKLKYFDIRDRKEEYHEKNNHRQQTNNSRSGSR